MAPSSPVSHFVRHIELYLTAVGLVVILAVPRLFAPETRTSALAVTALLVGVVHGLLFWVVRRRQRLLREALLEDVQGMLKDRINNKLQVLLLTNDAAAGPNLTSEDRERIEEVTKTVREVSGLLNRLTLESLTAWRTRYQIKSATE